MNHNDLNTIQTDHNFIYGCIKNYFENLKYDNVMLIEIGKYYDRPNIATSLTINNVSEIYSLCEFINYIRKHLTNNDDSVVNNSVVNNSVVSNCNVSYIIKNFKRIPYNRNMPDNKIYRLCLITFMYYKNNNNIDGFKKYASYVYQRYMDKLAKPKYSKDMTYGQTKQQKNYQKECQKNYYQLMATLLYYLLYLHESNNEHKLQHT